MTPIQSHLAYAGDDPVNGSDPTGLCNSQGNGNAWDILNPFSNNNPLYCWSLKNPGVKSAAVACAAGELDPEECAAAIAAAENEPSTGIATAWGPNRSGPVPGDFTVVRGGAAPPPVNGTTFSGAAGTTLYEAASGVPYGTIQVSTASEIRSVGGSVEWSPEPNRSNTYTNYLHVNIILRCVNPFSDPRSNPVPRAERIPS